MPISESSSEKLRQEEEFKKTEYYKKYEQLKELTQEESTQVIKNHKSLAKSYLVALENSNDIAALKRGCEKVILVIQEMLFNLSKSPGLLLVMGGDKALIDLISQPIPNGLEELQERINIFKSYL